MANLVIVASPSQDKDLADLSPFHLNPGEFVVNPLGRLPFTRRTFFSADSTQLRHLIPAVTGALLEAGSDVTLALVLCSLTNVTPQAERPQFVFSYGDDKVPLETLLPAFNPAPGGSLFLAIDGLAEPKPVERSPSGREPSSTENEQELYAMLRRFPSRALGDILRTQQCLDPTRVTITASAFGEYRVSDADKGGHPLRQPIHPIQQPLQLEDWWKDVPYYWPTTADHGALTRIILNGLLSGAAAGAHGVSASFETPYTPPKRRTDEQSPPKKEEAVRADLVIRRRRNVRISDLYHYIVAALRSETGNRVKIVGTSSGRNPQDFDRDLLHAPGGEIGEVVTARESV